MSTAGALIDRTYREWLYPPAEQPARFYIDDAGGISNSDTTIVTNTSWLNPEEEDLIGAGTIIEAERELVLVTAVSGSSPALTLTVRRSQLGTEAVAHADQTHLILTPDYGRQAVYDAIADSIYDLYPTLYKVRTDIIPLSSGWVDVGVDVEEVLDVRLQGGSQWHTLDDGWVELLQDFPMASSGKAIQFGPGAPRSGAAIVKFMARPQAQESEADTLISLNIDPSWHKAIVVGAAASMLRGADINAATVEFVTESLSREGFPVGSGESISNALLRFQDFLIQRRARALQISAPTTQVVEKIF